MLVYQSNLSAAPPFDNIVWINKEIITSKDPTTFQKLIYEGEQKIKMWVNISKKVGGKNAREKKLKVYVFTVYYEDNSSIIIQATPKFESKEKAEEQALKYGKMIGRLPTFLKKEIKTIHLNKSDAGWFTGSAKGMIVIHAGFFATRGAAIEFHEELLVHEAGHASIGNAYTNLKTGKYLKKLEPEEWKLAVKADNKFVSEYSKYKGEDFPESILAWIMVRYKKDRISEKTYNKIIESIPNRLKYFDEQNYDVYPLVYKQ